MKKSICNGVYVKALAAVLAAGICVTTAGCGNLAKGDNLLTPTVGIGYATSTPVPTVTEAPVTDPQVTQVVAENTPQVTEEPKKYVDPSEDTDLSHVLTDSFLQKLDVLIQVIDNYYYKDVTVEDLQTALYKGLYAGLNDPYSEYYTPTKYQETMESTSGEYYGIGSYVSQDVKTNVITLTKPFPEGPAYAAGVRAGDILVKVNDDDVTAMNIDDVVKIMKGPEGTKVKLTIMRDGESDFLEFVVTRAKVEVPTVEFEMKEGNIGYVSVSAFDSVTADQFILAVDELIGKEAESLIIDLRNNGGGVLDGCVKMADYLLPQGKMITYIKDKEGNRDEYKSKDGHQVSFPVVILVNQYSASASEVFTGALKYNDVATVIGVTTFGKGIVQSILPLTDGSGIKLTTSSYFTPADTCIHGIGIEPDIVVETSKEGDAQLDEAIKFLTEKKANN